VNNESAGRGIGSYKGADPGPTKGQTQPLFGQKQGLTGYASRGVNKSKTMVV